MVKQGVIPILAKLWNHGFYRVIFKSRPESRGGFLSSGIIVKHELDALDLRMVQKII